MKLIAMITIYKYHIKPVVCILLNVFDNCDYFVRNKNLH